MEAFVLVFMGLHVRPQSHFCQEFLVTPRLWASELLLVSMMILCVLKEERKAFKSFSAASLVALVLTFVCLVYEIRTDLCFDWDLLYVFFEGG